MGYQFSVPLAGLCLVRGSRPGQYFGGVRLAPPGAEDEETARGGIPASICLTLHPALGPVSRFDYSLDELPVHRHELAVPGLDWTLANTHALSEEYRRRYREGGDPLAVPQLLEMERLFELEEWVTEARRNDPDVRRVLGSRPGRPAGSRSGLARGIAVARYVDALRESTGESPASVFKMLGERGRLGVGERRIRQMYSEGAMECAERRRSALLFEGEGVKRSGWLAY